MKDYLENPQRNSVNSPWRIFGGCPKNRQNDWYFQPSKQIWWYKEGWEYQWLFLVMSVGFPDNPSMTNHKSTNKVQGRHGRQGNQGPSPWLDFENYKSAAAVAAAAACQQSGYLACQKSIMGALKLFWNPEIPLIATSNIRINIFLAFASRMLYRTLGSHFMLNNWSDVCVQ